MRGGGVHDGGMPRLQTRRFATPDEVRTFEHGHAELLLLDETADRSRDLRARLAMVDGHAGDRGHADLPAPPSRLFDLRRHARRDGRRAGDRHRGRIGLRDPARARRVGRRRRRRGSRSSGRAPRRFGVARRSWRTRRWRRSSSPTSWIRRRRWTGSATRRGESCCRPTTALMRGELNVFRGARSRRPAMASSPCSMARREPSAVAPPCVVGRRRSAWGSASALHTGEVEFVGAGRARRRGPCRRPGDVVRRPGRGRHLVDDEGPPGRIRPGPRGRGRPSS